MMGVEPAGQAAEGGQDQLGLGHYEAAARHVAALEVEAELGVEVTAKLGTGLADLGFMAQNDAVDHRFLDDLTAAMVGEAGVVVADDPGPVERRRHSGKEVA